jgi:hypothetical protein
MGESEDMERYCGIAERCRFSDIPVVTRIRKSVCSPFRWKRTTERVIVLLIACMKKLNEIQMKYTQLFLFDNFDDELQINRILSFKLLDSSISRSITKMTTIDHVFVLVN